MIVEMAKILPKYQVTLPQEIRDKLKIEIGSKVLFIENENGIIIKRVDQSFIEALRELSC